MHLLVSKLYNAGNTGAGCRFMLGDNKTPGQTKLKQCVSDELDNYFATLDDQTPCNLYELVMGQAEEALIRYLMNRFNNNQSRVAQYLGINRGTLRKRLKDYDI